MAELGHVEESKQIRMIQGAASSAPKSIIWSLFWFSIKQPVA